VDEKSYNILFVEVKWIGKQVGWNVVEELKRKSKLVQGRTESQTEKYLSEYKKKSL
jgi:hypothetical protein